MEKKQIKPINHPYMDKLQSTLNEYKYKLSCLEKRLVLIDHDSANASDYELNEKELIKIKTKGEIDILSRIIKLKEEYFIKYFKTMSVELDDMEKNYDKILNKAKSQRRKNKAIDNLMSTIKVDVLKVNDEVKLHYYKAIKQALK